MLAAAGWLLAGCSTISSMNPVNWWHRQEGGKIAEDRPAPPGADQPYPSIATVPNKPEAPDQDAMKKLTASLVADRTNAQHAAQSAPLADPSSPTASPSLFGVGTAPPPPPPGTTPPPKAASSGTPVASATMPAVTSPFAPAPPPAPATPPSPAPRKPVQSAPLEPLAAQTAPAQSTPPAASAQTPLPSSGQTAPPTVTANAGTPSAPVTPPVGPPPALPAGPPPRPAAAPPAPAAVVAPTPMPAPSTGTSATIVFLEKASNLSPPAADEVKAFAAKRGKGTISIVGYGDSSSSDPDAQSVAVNLGLSRAQSIVDVLKAAGVPGNAIRVSAEASGRGASLQVLQ
jgi:outer membrane protein OmpA-like peptidoglycan-associated protein